MNALQIFNYNDNPVSFKDENGVAYINATEMAKPFGKRPNDYLSLPTTIELVQAITRKYGNSNNQLVMTKGGSPANGGGTWMHEDVALDFAQWLSIDFKLWCNDRLKELMRYGVTASDNMLKQMLDDPDVMIGLLTSLKEERHVSALRATQIEEQQKVIDEQTPKVLFADAVSASNKSILVKELAITLKQNGINIGQNRLFAWLRAHGYLCVTGQAYNLPTQRSMDLGLFEVKQTSITKPNGTILVSKTPMVTGKGQVYFVNKFLNNKSND